MFSTVKPKPPPYPHYRKRTPRVKYTTAADVNAVADRLEQFIMLRKRQKPRGRQSKKQQLEQLLQYMARVHHVNHLLSLATQTPRFEENTRKKSPARKAVEARLRALATVVRAQTDAQIATRAANAKQTRLQKRRLHIRKNESYSKYLSRMNPLFSEKHSIVGIQTIQAALEQANTLARTPDNFHNLAYKWLFVASATRALKRSHAYAVRQALNAGKNSKDAQIQQDVYKQAVRNNLINPPNAT